MSQLPAGAEQMALRANCSPPAEREVLEREWPPPEPERCALLPEQERAGAEARPHELAPLERSALEGW